ncbi:MAG TPA: ribosome biogenesis GTPase YlqF [Rhodocyclaceae bacterium]|nr:ribosome biogenesis GTPase YlqF [Rhodocyclaceae bacterium]
MAIQWFPGHMTSARKKASEAMEFNDVIIEVLDARLPEASSNPMIKELRAHRQRPCLKLLNKADLADPVVTQQWLDFYNKQPGVKAVAISCKNAGEVARIPSHCRPLAPHRNDRIKPLRMMIMGIPNVGKSTLMNALLKRKVAKVGDEPAVTKHAQRLELSPTAVLTDTPGLMWPKIAHDTDGYMLAASHAIGRNAVIEEEVAFFLAGLLLKNYPKFLAERYKVDVSAFDGVAMIETVAKKRGCIHRSKDRAGELDLEKAAMIFLQDYRDGLLGRVSLESPASRAAMLAAAAEQAKAAAAAAALAGSGVGGKKLQAEVVDVAPVDDLSADDADRNHE